MHSITRQKPCNILLHKSLNRCGSKSARRSFRTAHIFSTIATSAIRAPTDLPRHCAVFHLSRGWPRDNIGRIFYFSDPISRDPRTQRSALLDPPAGVPPCTHRSSSLDLWLPCNELDFSPSLDQTATDDASYSPPAHDAHLLPISKIYRNAYIKQSSFRRRKLKIRDV